MNDSAIALARNTDPATSHEAARIASGKISALRRSILGVLLTATDGLTSRDIAKRTGTDFASITPRLKPMEAAGLIRRGAKARTEFNRAPATVWHITGHGTSEALKKSTEPA